MTEIPEGAVAMPGGCLNPVEHEAHFLFHTLLGLQCWCRGKEDAEHLSASGGVFCASVGEGSLKAQMDVMAERLDQLTEFPRDADDALLPAEWIARIAKHTGRAVTFDPAMFRSEMVVVGALALAAIEAYDRRYGATS